MPGLASRIRSIVSAADHDPIYGYESVNVKPRARPLVAALNVGGGTVHCGTERFSRACAGYAGVIKRRARVFVGLAGELVTPTGAAIVKTWSRALLRSRDEDWENWHTVRAHAIFRDIPMWCA